MAYQLSTYTTNSGITLTNAYLHIDSGRVSVNKTGKTAVIPFEIYASQTAYKAGAQPVKSDGYVFTDEDTTALLFTNTFGSPLGTDTLGTPTNVVDIFIAQAYLALAKHPSLTTLLNGATAV